ncbi:endolysin [Bacillus phage Moonbeam]|uniref:Peptidase n=1 Tax=Bacillus phage Moonbeam TaxID=1540091 RepID=A0A0A0RV08_9CAUD|nr:endolysin [Bacillus phage Moonbeam]AIW03428.1 peptidase [Bacillus phage Moonbeam]
MASLEGLHPYVKAKTEELIANANNRLKGNYKIMITQGLRTKAEQNNLYAQGRSQAQLNAVGLGNVKAKPSMQKVTNARGGYSMHNYGLAIDFALRSVDGKDVTWDMNKDFDGDGKADWMEVVEEAKKLGFEWGGDWKSFKDYPHFQLTAGLTDKQVYSGMVPKFPAYKPNTSSVKAPVNTPGIFRKGDSGSEVKALQEKLIKLGYKLPKFGADGQYGDEMIAAVKAFQKDNGLAVDGITGKDTTTKLDARLLEEAAPKAEDLPKVLSLGDKYSFQVKALKTINVYKYANLTGAFRSLANDTIFSVYGYTEDGKAYAVPGGFVSAKEVQALLVTITTGGLSTEMEAEFRAFLKEAKIGSQLNVYVTGNPSSTIETGGLDLVTVKKFLDQKGWYYK